MNFHPNHAIRKNRNRNQNEMSNIKLELADTKRALERSRKYGISLVFLFSLLYSVMGYICINKYSINLLPSSNSYQNIGRIDEVTSSSPVIDVQQLDDAFAVVDSLPNVLLIGVQKGGSTAIWTWLTQHNVCIGETFPDKYAEEKKHFKKEMHFFDHPSRYERGVDFYKEHYQHCVNNLTKNEAEKQLIIDATPDTFWFPKNVFEVYKNDPNLKIIVSLREPISRELSLYNHMIQQYKIRPNQTWIKNIFHTNGTIKTFEEKILDMDKQYYKNSHYALYLTKWFTLFDPNQILVLSYEKEVRPGTSAKERIMEFLGPSLLFGDPYRPYQPGTFDEANEMNHAQKIQMPCSVVERLSPVMDGWNKELYELIASHKPRGISIFPEFEPVGCKLDQ